MNKINFLVLLATLFAALLFTHCQPTAPKQNSPDSILFNGVFFTADSSHQQATAIALKDGLILAIGSDSDIKTLAGTQTQMTDLKGAFVMPGFIEGHGHFNSLGQSIENLNLLHTKNWAEITGMVAEKVKSTPAGAWISGRGWHQEKWNSSPGITVNGYPYHDALSDASPDHAVVLFHASGHGLMANAKAMQMAGISQETPDPVGGRIVRDARGRLTGVFEENAMDLIGKSLGDWENLRTEAQKIADFERATALATQAALEKGICSFQDAGSSFWELDQYARLATEGKMKVRLWAMMSQPKPEEFSKMSDFPKIDLGNGYFTCRAVKAYFDGALGSYGAWLLASYDDKPNFFGQNTTPIETIATLAPACKNAGLQLCVHAIGDRANREILNIFESGGGKQLRWRIEHAQHLDPLDIPRFSQLGVIASMQAIHCTSDAPFVVKRLGEKRAREGAYAWRSILHSGGHIANGTDAPVEEVDPLPCIYASVTRKRADTGFEFFAEQKMTREEALLSYTLWNAYAAFEEPKKGSLTPGKYADLTVLDKNLLTCPPEEILKAKVVRTIVGGVSRYVQSAGNN